MAFQGEPQSSRQRMRPWLENRINSGEIPGLEWIDKSQHIFKVRWKNVGNREWREDDSQIFKEWAVHTGRYTEGVDQADWPTWKTRFRCALTKLPDIKELKDQNQLEGNIAEPYRVYQFVQRTPSPSNGSSPQNTCDVLIKQESMFPTTIPDEISTERLASDLDRIHTDDLIHCYDSGEIRTAAGEMDTTSGGFENVVQSMDVVSCVSNITEIANKPYPGERKTQLEIKPDIINNSHLYITLRYRTEMIFEKLITNVHGCRVYHGNHEQFIQEFEQQEFRDTFFGSHEAEPIMLPRCETTNPQQRQLTDNLLNVMDRGVHFKMEQGNIVAMRKCRCTVFISSQSVNNGDTTKLLRDQPTVIFDFHNYFYPALEKYIHNKGPKPSFEVIVGFGQRFDLEKDPVSNLLISATLVHSYACNLHAMVTCSSPESPQIEISKSDDYDKFLDQLRFTTQIQPGPGVF